MRQWILTLLHLLGWLLQQSTNRRLQMFQETTPFPVSVSGSQQVVEIHRVTLLPKNLSRLEDLVFPSRMLAGGVKTIYLLWTSLSAMKTLLPKTLPQHYYER